MYRCWADVVWAGRAGKSRRSLIRSCCCQTIYINRETIAFLLSDSFLFFFFLYTTLNCIIMTCSKDEESKMKRYLKSQLRIRPPVDSDPRLLSRGWKALILVIISLAATTAGFSSTIYFPGTQLYIYKR